MYAHLAQMMHLLVTPTSGPVTIFTDGPVADDEAMKAAMEKVNALQCKVETTKIVRLVPLPAPDVGVRVVLEGGKEYKMGYLAHKPRTILAGLDMMTGLGVEIEDDPILGQSVQVDQLFSTNVRGVFAAGDAATPMKVVANAMGSGKLSSPVLFHADQYILGSTVAAGIVQQLVAEDMELLLAEKKTV
jgi:pyruvate/2-oxoglutarate dehydrogenase complex dihydrolipoamide dehydrogenase (E3) component